MKIDIVIVRKKPWFLVDGKIHSKLSKTDISNVIWSPTPIDRNQPLPRNPGEVLDYRKAMAGFFGTRKEEKRDTVEVDPKYIMEYEGLKGVLGINMSKVLKENNRNIADFTKFMGGQTVCANNNGETIFFLDDVTRFLNRRPVID